MAGVEIDAAADAAFCVVPQHMPLELLAMTPPIVQADALAVSGPRR